MLKAFIIIRVFDFNWSKYLYENPLQTQNLLFVKFVKLENFKNILHVQ
jgi:hypothetical protein